MNIGKKKLIDILKNKYQAYIQGNRAWYQISCPFCGDSPNPRSRHCNIRVAEEDDIVIVHCFQLKCKDSGVMTKAHLRKMGIYDKDITDFIERNYSKSKEAISKTYDVDMAWTPSDVILPEVAKYFFERTQKELTLDRVMKYRIVPSVRDFYNKNVSRFNKEIQDRFKKQLGASIDDFIGFLNENGTALEVRNIKPNVSKDKRFLKITLSSDDKTRFMKTKPYVIKRNLNYLPTEDKLNMIVLTEGRFDCINAMEHFVPENTADGVFISSTVSGFKALIREYTKKYPYRDIVIFADRDVSDNNILDMVKGIEYRIQKLYVARNETGKDLGDFRDKITPVHYVLDIKGGK